MLFPALFYIAWDALFTARGIWSFNEKYVSGISYFGLPLEEILFFFVVPYCCLFIYECIRCYFPQIKSNGFSVNFIRLLAILSFAACFFFFDKEYTFYTCLFLSIALLIFSLFRHFFSELNTTVFLLAYAIILIPFLIVNGFLTAMPVVLYNNAENTAIRIYSIPAEDIFYGMLLFFLNALLYEKFRSR